MRLLLLPIVVLQAVNTGQAISSKLRTGRDIQALNATLSSKLRAVKRFSLDEFQAKFHDADILREPLIITDACLLGGDASTEDVPCYSPLSLNWTHAGMLERCGDSDVSGGVREKHLNYLRSLPPSIAASFDALLRQTFKQSLEEVIATHAAKWTFKGYFEQRHSYSVGAFPDMLHEFLFPLTLKTIPYSFCTALKKDVVDMKYAFPQFRFFEMISSETTIDEELRQKIWESIRFYIAPQQSFAHPTHWHGAGESIFAVLMEGKKVWQMMERTESSHQALTPYTFGRTGIEGEIGYQKAPCEVAESFPVFVTEQNVGELLYLPQNFIHLVYNVEDAVSLQILDWDVPEFLRLISSNEL